MTILAKASIPLPPIAEQKRIIAEAERCLSLVRGLEEQADANLQRAERMRQAILASAFHRQQRTAKGHAK